MSLYAYCVIHEIWPLTGGTESPTANGTIAALNQFDTFQKLRELPEFAELPEVDARTVELFEIFSRLIIENIK